MGSNSSVGDVNFHGFFMSTAFIFSQGEGNHINRTTLYQPLSLAILAYRLYRHEVKILSKSIHGFLHIVSLTLGGVGLGAIVTHKDLYGYPHFKSFHSWIGLTVLSGYLVQVRQSRVACVCSSALIISRTK